MTSFKILSYLLPFVLAFAMLFVGASEISVISEIIKTFDSQTLSPQMGILLDIRLPRIVLAMLIGAILSLSGGVMQSLFQNPLIDPFFIGISSGAAFGCALCIGFLPFLPLPLCAFGCAFGCAMLVLLLARLSGGGKISLILCGVVVSSFLSALAGLIKVFVEPQAAQAIVAWLLGSLALAKWNDVFIVLIGLSACVPLYFLRWKIDILALGDLQSMSLGINSQKLRILIIFCISFACAFALCVSGVIGWIGLVVPYMVRILFGASLRHCFFALLALGASFLLVFDSIARVSYELPVGAVCAIFGAPFFLYLLIRWSR